MNNFNEQLSQSSLFALLRDNLLKPMSAEIRDDNKQNVYMMEKKIGKYNFILRITLILSIINFLTMAAILCVILARSH